MDYLCKVISVKKYLKFDYACINLKMHKNDRPIYIKDEGIGIQDQA